MSICTRGVQGVRKGAVPKQSRGSWLGVSKYVRVGKAGVAPGSMNLRSNTAGAPNYRQGTPAGPRVAQEGIPPGLRQVRVCKLRPLDKHSGVRRSEERRVGKEW